MADGSLSHGYENAGTEDLANLAAGAIAYRKMFRAVLMRTLKDALSNTGDCDAATQLAARNWLVRGGSSLYADSREVFVAACSAANMDASVVMDWANKMDEDGWPSSAYDEICERYKEMSLRPKNIH
jgi:hypothetical protein